jgi:hypothetical protein
MVASPGQSQFRELLRAGQVANDPQDVGLFNERGYCCAEIACLFADLATSSGVVECSTSISCQQRNQAAVEL